MRHRNKKINKGESCWKYKLLSLSKRGTYLYWQWTWVIYENKLVDAINMKKYADNNLAADIILNKMITMY